MATAANNVNSTQHVTVPYPVRFAAAGAAGGLCSFLLSRLSSTGPFISKPVYLDLPTEVILGSVAALFGVYLLTASDPTSVKTVIFAVACGLFWSSTITATQSYLSQHSDSQVVAATQQASTVAKQVAAQPNVQSDASVKSASSQLTSALAKLPSISSNASRDQIVANSKDAVQSIATATPTQATVGALKDIGLASAKANATQVTALTYDKLHELAAKLPDGTIRSEAQSAAKQLAEASPAISEIKGSSVSTGENVKQ